MIEFDEIKKTQLFELMCVCVLLFHYVLRVNKLKMFPPVYIIKTQKSEKQFLSGRAT